MKTLLKLLVITLTLLTIVTACKQSDKPAEHDFEAYVTAYTHGLVPADAPVTISLSSVTRLKPEAGAELTERVLGFDPEIKGKAFWIDDHTLRFFPDTKWPRDASIQVSLFLNKLTDVPEAFHHFRFQIRTLPLTFELRDVALETTPEWGSDAYLLKGKLLASEPLLPDAADELLRVDAGGENLAVELSQEESTQHLLFTAGPVKRSSKNYDLLISWNGKSLGSSHKGELSIPVAAKGVFMPLRTEVLHLPDQAVHIWFSDDPDPSQNLNGLIQLQPEMAVRTEVIANKIVVYPIESASAEVEMIITAGLKSANGMTLNRDFRQQISFDQLKPQLRFVGQSTILSGKEKGMLQFQATGLKAVDVHVVKVFSNNMLQFLQWNSLTDYNSLRQVGRIIARQQVVLSEEEPFKRSQWQTYGIDLNKLIERDKASLYRVYLTFKPEYAVWDCPGASSGFERTLAGPDASELSQWEYDNYYDPAYYYPDDFQWNQRDNPCSSSYYYSDRFPARNIISSSLGLMATESNLTTKELTFVVNRLETAEPLSAAKVELFDFQQQLLASGVTDASGMVRLRWSDVRPFVAVASLDGERAWLRLDESSARSFSRFGVAGSEQQHGLKGFIFTERGVYRPGDTLFVGFILKQDAEKLPDAYPVVLELTNARQQLAARQTSSSLNDGMCLFRIPTAAEAPTGLWTARIKAGNAVFSRNIRVETIKPNRLRIVYAFGNERIEPNERDRKVQLRVNWLHGAAASGLEVSLDRLMKAADPVFERWPAFSFSDASKYVPSFDKTTVKGRTDEAGVWNTSLKLPVAGEARGNYKIQWTARVTEPGGDFSTTTHTADFWPYSHYLGLASPEPGRNGYLETGKNHRFDIVRVDVSGRATGEKALLVEVFKMDWSWWWSGDGGQQADYVSTYSAQKILERSISLSQGKGSFVWSPAYPTWGNFFVRVSDPDGGHSTARMVYVDWADGYSREDRAATGGANILTMSLDKDVYSTHDKAVLSFVGPAKGKALISLEKASRQINSWWVDTQAGENKVVIPLSTACSPNVYVHVTLLQAVGQLANDMPMRAYGVASIPVEDPASRLDLRVSHPSETKTGQPFELSVQEKSGKAMTYVLALVDEGLLDLTNFKTPDPWSWYYAKEALALKTWDMYDLVLGAYGGTIGQQFTIGGDESLPDREKARQSRFKPVVRLVGPFTLKAGQKAGHSFSIDNYIGSVRVMAVAVAGNAFGNHSSVMTVRQPLMVLGTLPRLLRQRDEVVMPVTVFSSLKGTHEIVVNVKAEGALKLEGEANQKVIFEKAGEKMLRFKLRASSESGTARVTISASGGGHQAKETVELSVQNPNLRTYEVKSLMLEKGKAVRHELNLPGEKPSQMASVEVSALPQINLRKRLAQLTEYPYGCTEQIVSAAFAQLYLSELTGSKAEETLETNQRIQSAVRQLSIRQRPDGSVSYWPGSSWVQEWTEVYAGHFMLLAARADKAVPSMFLNLWTKNQRGKAAAWRPDVYNETLTNDLLQAYRLYALALQGEAPLSAMNRLREHPLLSYQAAATLAAAYAIAGQDQAARELLLGNKLRKTSLYHNELTLGSSTRDLAMKAEALTLLKEKNAAFPLLQQLATTLNSEEWLSTQSAAWALYAWQMYAKTFPSGGQSSFSLSQNESTEIVLKQPVFTRKLNTEYKIVEMRNTGDNDLFVSVTTSGIDAVGTFRELEKGISMTVAYLDENGKPIDPFSLKQGTAFTAVTTVVNPTDKTLSFLALNQFVPAAWEIVNDRLMESNQITDLSNEYVDYRDDRVIYFFNLLPGAKKVFSTRLIATYEGVTTLPATHCEAMYDKNVAAYKGGGKAVVKARID